MKILTKKQQKKILDLVTILETESIRYVDAKALPIFADHLTEISLVVGGIHAMENCVKKAVSFNSKE